jgi:hypothetical protein
MSSELPTTAPTKLIVVMAFDRDDEGQLRPAFEPMEMPSEDYAKQRARLLATRYAGAIAWTRAARPDTGEFGEPNVLFEAGEIPEMD